MANPTMTLIGSPITVGSGGVASVTFSSIPATYTDLVVKASVRSLRASSEDGMGFTVNSSGATSWLLLTGNGSSASSGTNSSLGYGSFWTGRIPGNTTTSNTFGNWELYLPNYILSGAKSYSLDAVTEDNSSSAYASLQAGYYSSVGAVTSLTLSAANSNLAQYSTFYLYGISNS